MRSTSSGSTLLSNSGPTGSAPTGVAFTEIVRTEEQLREILGYPSTRATNKAISALDEHCRAFIARSPFLLIGSSDAHGNVDLSPKGDPPGFVAVLDEHTLAIPDRPGNRRADTFGNILQNPKVGLYFLIPGRPDTLRVSGRAMIVRDLWLRERLAAHGKVPDLALVVTVEEAFMHCPKCMIRSSLWDADQWPRSDDLASLAAILIDHAKLTQSVDEVQQLLDKSIQEALY